MKRWIRAIALAVILASFFCLNAGALSRQGSRGSEVRQIQTKLKQWGYYDGAVDGAFGGGETSAKVGGETFSGVGIDRGDFLRERFGLLRPSAVEEPRDDAVVGVVDELGANIGERSVGVVDVGRLLKRFPTGLYDGES